MGKTWWKIYLIGKFGDFEIYKWKILEIPRRPGSLRYLWFFSLNTWKKYKIT